jgi:hypothetical protein
MHRIDETGNVAGMFTEGNPSVGEPATKVTDDWLNDVQENLCDTITGSGGTLVKGTYTQLRTAINALIAAALTTFKTVANTWTDLNTFQKGVVVTQTTTNGTAVTGTANGTGSGVKGLSTGSGPAGYFATSGGGGTGLGLKVESVLDCATFTPSSAPVIATVYAVCPTSVSWSNTAAVKGVVSVNTAGAVFAGGVGQG